MVKPGIPVEIIYEPVKLGVLGGRIYVEAHKDIYGRIDDFFLYGYERLEQKRLSEKVDLFKFYEVLNRQDGMPVDITLPES
jgi:L,D-transpeptidase ErfK/SrfK